MHKTDRFTFLLDAEDRRRLVLLSREVRRSQGDTLRWLLRMASTHLAGPAADAEPRVHMAEDADMPEVGR